MKKLMILAAAVVCATVGMAANVDWSIAGKAFGPSSADPATNGRAAYYLVYIFNSSDLETATGYLKDWTTENQGKFADLSVSNGRTTKTGAASGSVKDLSGASATLVAIALDTYASETTTLADAQNYITSSPVTQNTYSGTDSPTTASFATWGSYAKVESIPEPTSAMQLLLGIAGLALKRKRA